MFGYTLFSWVQYFPTNFLETFSHNFLENSSYLAANALDITKKGTHNC